MKKNIFLIFVSFFLLQNLNAQFPKWDWAKAISGTSYEFGFAIAVDHTGNIYSTGSFMGNADFDPGTGIYSITSASATHSDIYISKLDSLGNFIWAKTIGGINNDAGYAIAVDPIDGQDIFITGFFSDTVDLDPGPGVFNLFSSGGAEVFISKYDSAGNFIWAKQ